MTKRFDSDKFKEVSSKISNRTKSTFTKVSDTTKTTISRVADTTKSTVSKTTNFAKTSTQHISSFLVNDLPSTFAFFSVPELLKWSETVTKSAASIYDKALDANYLATHIGGGNHRMFDGGHDIFNAWDAAKSASTDDTFQQEVIGYTSALWKDVTTVKGLPFTTWSKDAYNANTEWIIDTVPGATKSWFYDLMSFDAFEILSTGLGTVSMIYFLSKDDTKKLSEILGAMGIISIISANPLMGIAVILCTAYSFLIKKNKIQHKKVIVGAGMAGISAAIFAVLGLPVLIELGIVIVVTKLLRDQIIENKDLLEFLKERISKLPSPNEIKESVNENYAKIYATLSQLGRKDNVLLIDS